MRTRTRQITAAIVTAAASAAFVAPSASAGQVVVRLCPGGASPPIGQRGWSTVTSGGAIYPSAIPVAWADTCSRPRNSSGTWTGAGGEFGDTALPGSTAYLRFTPPAGSSIISFQATVNWSRTAESYAEVGTFTSTGRALDSLSNTGQSGTGYDSAQLGADGGAGLQLGARCPSALPAGVDSCGGAGSAYSEGRIYIDDPSPASLTAAASIDGAGNVTVTWSASDPQSGIASVRVGPRAIPTPPPTASYPCSDLGAPVCQPSVTGSTVAGQLAPGQTGSYLVTATPPGGQDAEQTVTVTRPGTGPGPTTPQPTTPQPTTPQPTTPQPTTPQGDPKPTAFKVSLRTKAIKGRKLRLSGSAKGCSRVKIKPPKRGTYFAMVNRKGQWSRTVARKRGTYTVLCGTARAKRTAR